MLLAPAIEITVGAALAAVLSQEELSFHIKITTLKWHGRLFSVDSFFLESPGVPDMEHTENVHHKLIKCLYICRQKSFIITAKY